MLASLRENFNLRSCRRALMTIGIKEVPCMLLTFGGAAIGLSFLNHNAGLELAMALSISLITEYVAENHIFKKKECCAQHKKPEADKVFGLLSRKGVLVALSIGVVTWWAHGMLLHDDHNHHHVDNHIERHHNHADDGHHHHDGEKRRNFAEHLTRKHQKLSL